MDEEKKYTLEDPEDKYNRIMRKFGLVNLINILKANGGDTIIGDQDLLGKIYNDLRTRGYSYFESYFGIKTIQCLNMHVEVKDGLGDSCKHEIYLVK